MMGEGMGLVEEGGMGLGKDGSTQKPLPTHWAMKLAIIVGILPPVDMGLPVSIESWWTQWYKDSLPKPWHKH